MPLEACRRSIVGKRPLIGQSACWLKDLPFVGRRNNYQPKGCDDALRLGSKGRYGSRVDEGKTMIPCYTWAKMSAVEIRGL